MYVSLEIPDRKWATCNIKKWSSTKKKHQEVVQVDWDHPMLGVTYAQLSCKQVRRVHTPSVKIITATIFALKNGSAGLCFVCSVLSTP